jgi:hypothetical protein
VRNIAGGGIGLVGLLLTVLIMGGMGAVTLTELGGEATTTTVVAPTVPITTTSPGTSTTSVATEADRVACIADAKILETAIGAYDAASGYTVGVETNITPGLPSTYPSGTQATDLLSGSWLSSWPTSTSFSLSLSTTTAGEISVYVPANSTSAVPYLTEGPTQGCNAL